MLRAVIAGLVAAIFTTPVAFAQDYPKKSVQFIVPSAPGGGTDASGRFIAQKMSEKWGVPVIVENKTGAGFNIAGQFVASSTPDGYTFYVGDACLLTINPLIYKDLGFDPEKGLKAVSLLTTTPYVLMTSATQKLTTLKEFLDFANANPGKGNYGGSTFGTPAHMTWVLLKKLTNADIKYIPYKGTSDAFVDLLGGSIQVAVGSPNSSKQYVDSGQMIPVAMTSNARLPTFPNVPTVAESVPGYQEVVSTTVILTTGDTPDDIVNKVAKDLKELMTSEEGNRWFTDAGYTILAYDPEETRNWIAKESEQNADLAKVAGMEKQ